MNFLKEKDINYVLIPEGMIPECQPLDISINKVFKDNLKIKFEVFKEEFKKKYIWINYSFDCWEKNKTKIFIYSYFSNSI